jgi:transcriptional regulator with XRE-family HTH domain
VKQENRWFGEQIRTARKAKGWCQTDLGKRLGRGQGWVALVEAGKLTVREHLKETLMDVLGLFTRKRELHLVSVPSSAHRWVARNTRHRCQIPLFRLEDATHGAIEDWIEQSPRYEVREVRDLLSDATGVIHQIPKLFSCEGEGEFNLKNIRGYFGRSSAGVKGLADNLYQRFRFGYTDRKDSHGIIFAVTSIKATALLERFGIGFLKHLKKNHGLCIANATDYDRGRVGTTEPGFLYMTFKIRDQEEDWGKMLTPRQIDGAINQMMEKAGASQLGSQREIKDSFSDAFRQANEPSYMGILKPYMYHPKPNRKIAS